MKRFVILSFCVASWLSFQGCKDTNMYGDIPNPNTSDTSKSKYIAGIWRFTLFNYDNRPMNSTYENVLLDFNSNGHITLVGPQKNYDGIWAIGKIANQEVLDIKFDNGDLFTTAALTKTWNIHELNDSLLILKDPMSDDTYFELQKN